jgi:K(+)-stimulated pyrophosphate-energized sodium pump
MNLSILAAEGGYQEFTLGSTEKIILLLSGLSALLAIAVGFYLQKKVLAMDTGSPKMQAIAKQIHDGAIAYLKRQFRTIGMIVVPLAVVVFATSSAINKPNGKVALGFVSAGLARTVAFLLGCVASGLTGYIGMSLATRGNVRTAAAALSKERAMPKALDAAFKTGGVAGMFTVGLGLLGATLIIFIFQNSSSVILVGFGFGGSLLALFLRVGGGIFTKAADVGADLVGKVEAGIPEDDPRNPATIADNVGDNVGDCAGMAADLFESYEVTLVASIILGVSAFKAVYPNEPKLWALGLIFPLAARAVGVIASIAGIFAVKAKDDETDALKPINRGFLVAGLLTVVGVGLVAMLYVGNKAGTRKLDDGTVKATLSNIGLRCWLAVVIGLVLAQVVSRLTEYYTATHYKPVKDIAESARTGPATVVLSGTAIGLESSVYAVLSIALAIGTALALGGGNLQVSFYLVALCGMGMLATTGVIVSEDTFGPVSDNAAGIAEMSGEFHGDAERIMVALDAVGNTTKAVTKGFAIGSAVIGAVAIFASFIEGAVKGGVGKLLSPTTGLMITAKDIADSEIKPRGVFDLLPINVADPKVFIGLLIGGAVPFLFSALAVRAVSRTAGVVVEEVRKQFADGKIMAGTKEPDSSAVIDICTTASLRELTTPALLAVLTPIAVGFGLGFAPLGAFSAAVILTGQLMANYLSNAGGAWDNAKKYIEDGHEGGKGSEAHKAAVIGDTVGDPFKDTAGPALNPLIKVMNLVSLLVLPAIISLSDKPLRFVVAGIAVAILVASIVKTSRQKSVIGAASV